jgi:protein-S-isoprenylcysteine O-methyltransferase Ste14
VTEDHAGVYFPPPLIHALGVVSGVNLSKLVPLMLPPSVLLTTLGASLLAIALAIASSAIRQFALSENPLAPNRPVGGLMKGGPFRYTRNPLYLALALMHAGIGLVSGDGWVILTLPPALLVVRYFVIAREEAYLIRRFGRFYLDYQAQVRRWF